MHSHVKVYETFGGWMDCSIAVPRNAAPSLTLIFTLRSFKFIFFKFCQIRLSSSINMVNLTYLCTAGLQNGELCTWFDKLEFLFLIFPLYKNYTLLMVKTNESRISTLFQLPKVMIKLAVRLILILVSALMSFHTHISFLLL